VKNNQYLETVFIFSFIILCVDVLYGEVIDSSSNGFTVKNTVNLSATPEQVYQSIVNVESWWNSAHTYSGNSGNLSIEAKAGGCFCEKLESGSVQHMVVVFADPGNTLRLTGGLGPLQSMGVTGSLTFSLSKTDSGTDLEVTYTVGGYAPGGLQNLASPVDYVLSEQIARLKNFIEKGKVE